MNDTYIIEQFEGKWRLIILERDSETTARSVKDIIESEDINQLSHYIFNNGWIEHIDAPVEELPDIYKQIKLNIDHTKRLTYIRDCHQAVVDAELDLIARRHELQEAIHGNFPI